MWFSYVPLHSPRADGADLPLWWHPGGRVFSSIFHMLEPGLKCLNAWTRRSRSLSPHDDRYQMVNTLKMPAGSEIQFMVKYAKLCDKITSHRWALASARRLYSISTKFEKNTEICSLKHREPVAETHLSHDQDTIHAENGCAEMCDFCLAALMFLTG